MDRAPTEVAARSNLKTRKVEKLVLTRQTCSPLIQLFFGFASDIDQTSINRDIRDGNWLSRILRLLLGVKSSDNLKGKRLSIVL